MNSPPAEIPPNKQTQDKYHEHQMVCAREGRGLGEGGEGGGHDASIRSKQYRIAATLKSAGLQCPTCYVCTVYFFTFVHTCNMQIKNTGASEDNVGLRGVKSLHLDLLCNINMYT